MISRAGRGSLASSSSAPRRDRRRASREPAGCRRPLAPSCRRPAAAGSVVEVRRAVERRRDVDVVLAAEVEHLVVEQREVRGDHEREVACGAARSSLSASRHDLLDQREVQQRLAALELDLDAAATATGTPARARARAVSSDMSKRLLSALCRETWQ